MHACKLEGSLAYQLVKRGWEGGGGNQSKGSYTKLLQYMMESHYNKIKVNSDIF
jgi:hypothetical protein